MIPFRPGRQLIAALSFMFAIAAPAQTLNWVFVSSTGVPRATSTSRPLYIYLTAPGDIYIDDITVVAGSSTNGTSVLTNGTFETGTFVPWLATNTSVNTSVISTNIPHTGSYSLHLVQSSAGSSQGTAIYQEMPQLTVGATYTLGFWYRQTTNANGGALVVRFSNNGIVTSNDPAPPLLPDTNGPTIFAVNPARGSTNGALTQVSVTFSEPVIGVTANNLLVNGQPAATVNPASGAATNYTFTFTQPGPGTVAITWSSGQGITDVVGNPFDHTATNASWNYTLIDTVPPVVNVLTPPAGTTINHLTQVDVTFSEPVTGVNASDLLVNGSAAVTNLAGSGSGPYTFQFPQPANGTVTLAWAGGHDIADTATNAFAGGSWTNVLDPTATPTVRINEFLASNISTNGLYDQFGNLEDWIELYNYGSNAVNLAGYSLTDDNDQPDKWIFPAVTLGPGQFLIVFASERDLKTVGGTNMLHTSFTLGTAGDYLALFNAESPRVALTVFTPKYPDQRNDYSYGYDSSNQLRYFSVPTPGSANGNSSISATVSNVTFSVQRGFYNQPFPLTLSDATPGAVIRYTTDGSQPTESNGSTYTNALSVDHLTMVRAAAFLTDYLPSLVGTHTYIFLTNVLNQPTNPPGFPITTDWSGNGWPSDYGMDQRIITNAAYSPEITNDLLALPALSIVLKQDEMFGTNGIYTSMPAGSFRPDRACSVELINPDGSAGFQIDAGVKLHGGGSAGTPMKHPLGLKFKGKYGPGKLNYSFFPDSPVSKFDGLVLRSDYNNHWTHAQSGGISAVSAAQRARGGLIRDPLVKDLEAAMGDFSSHSRYVHLYINGLYWGVYNPCEDLDSDFAASYLGGDDSDYDALKGSNGTLSIDGNTNAYTTMLSYNNVGLANLSQYNQIRQYLDMVQYVDYMLLNFYGGNEDWGTLQNWVAIRKREPGALFKFMCWDEERTFEGTNDTPGASSAGMKPLNNLSPGNLQSNLVRNAEYRLLFADRAYKFMFNGGILSSNGVIPYWQTRAAQLYQPIVAESARWGDSVPKTNVSPLPYPSYTTNTPYYSRNENWLGEQGRMFTNYFPYRTAVVLAQLKAVGLYPAIDAPAYNQFGGQVPAGFNLAITAPLGTIYYTTNGTDPRVYGTSAVSPQAAIYSSALTINTSMVVRARALSGTNWSALADAAFTVGSLGVPLRITELMYNPIGGSAFEFLELQNIGVTPLDISSYSFIGINFVFPASTTIQPGAVLLLANNANPSQFTNRYPGVSVFGYYGGSLDNNGERIALLDRNSQVVTEVTYNNAGGWPTAANGGGYSLELIDPWGDLNSPANWRASSSANGTPGLPPTALPLGNVVLNEIAADNAASVSNAGKFPDWLELFNRSTNSVSIANWSLSDSGNARKFVFPTNITLAPGDYFVVWCDTNNASPGMHSGFNIAKGGESLFLYDANTNRVDAVTFGQQITDLTLGRVNDLWQLTVPTTNAINVAAGLASSTNITVNEWLVTNSPPWIELFNRNSNAPVALHGIYLATSNSLFRIGTYSFLPPRGFLQLFTDTTAGPDHADLNVPAPAGMFVLYSDTAIESERLVYGPQTVGTSEGRFPDGAINATNRYFMPLTTPGAPNLIPNNAPSLAVISNRFVHLGQTIQFIAAVTDADSWYQTLAFSLTNSPVAAAIGTTGGFTWTVTNVPAPGTNTITVRVTDNGTPALSDAKTFLVIVRPPLQFNPSVFAGNGNLNFSFNSVPGDMYQLQCKTNLDDPAWLPLGSPIPGNGNTITLTNSTVSPERRFFRLMVTSP